ncbi:MAG: hypothetical protein ABFE13_07255, partial [Phycisphaerales bacterium]
MATKGYFMEMRPMRRSLGWGCLVLLCGVAFAFTPADGAESNQDRSGKIKDPTSAPLAHKAAPLKDKSARERRSSCVCKRQCHCGGKAGDARFEYAHFVEVEIALDQTYTLTRLQSLPRAPGSRLDLRQESGRLKAQWPATVVADLLEQGAKVTVLREFMLAQGAGDKSRSTLGQAATAATCSGSSVTDSNNTDHSIPLDDWTYSE